MLPSDAQPSPCDELAALASTQLDWKMAGASIPTRSAIVGWQWAIAHPVGAGTNGSLRASVWAGRHAGSAAAAHTSCAVVASTAATHSEARTGAGTGASTRRVSPTSA